MSFSLENVCPSCIASLTAPNTVGKFKLKLMVDIVCLHLKFKFYAIVLFMKLIQYLPNI